MIILPIPTALLTHFSLKVRVGRMYSKVPDGTAHCGSLPSSFPSAHRRRLLPATNSDPSMHTYRMSAPPAEVTTVWRGGLRMTSSMMERQVFFLWPNTAINYERKELFGRDHGHNTFTNILLHNTPEPSVCTVDKRLSVVSINFNFSLGFNSLC